MAPRSIYSVAGDACEQQPGNSTAEWNCCPGGLMIAGGGYLPRNAGVLILWSTRAPGGSDAWPEWMGFFFLHPPHRLRPAGRLPVASR